MFWHIKTEEKEPNNTVEKEFLYKPPDVYKRQAAMMAEDMNIFQNAIYLSLNQTLGGAFCIGGNLLSLIHISQGYVVYRATSKNGKYKAVSTIKKGSTVSYTNKKLTSKKTRCV